MRFAGETALVLDIRRSRDKPGSARPANLPADSLVTAASNGRALTLDMVRELTEAFDNVTLTGQPELVHQHLRKIRLGGQDPNEILRHVFERSILGHDYGVVEQMLKLDYDLIPSIQPIRMNNIWPNVIVALIAN